MSIDFLKNHNMSILYGLFKMARLSRSLLSDRLGAVSSSHAFESIGAIPFQIASVPCCTSSIVFSGKTPRSKPYCNEYAIFSKGLSRYPNCIRPAPYASKKSSTPQSFPLNNMNHFVKMEAFCLVKMTDKKCVLIGNACHLHAFHLCKFR